MRYQWHGGLEALRLQRAHSCPSHAAIIFMQQAGYHAAIVARGCEVIGCGLTSSDAYGGGGTHSYLGALYLIFRTHFLSRKKKKTRVNGIDT